MKQYISESRAIYEDNYHGLFSKKLAEWAIGKMKVEDKETGKLRKIRSRSIGDVENVLRNYGIDMDEKYLPTAWYVFNMCFADYQKALKTDEQRAYYVEETLFDPDGTPCNVLDCFVAKMCNAKEPIYWEDFI